MLPRPENVSSCFQTTAGSSDAGLELERQLQMAIAAIATSGFIAEDR